MNDDDKLLTIQEAAAFLRTPVATVRFWRSQRVGPLSFKIGRRIHYCCPKSWPGSTSHTVSGDSAITDGAIQSAPRRSLHAGEEGRLVWATSRSVRTGGGGLATATAQTRSTPATSTARSMHSAGLTRSPLRRCAATTSIRRPRAPPWPNGVRHGSTDIAPAARRLSARPRSTWLIIVEFGSYALSAVKPSDVKAWTARLSVGGSRGLLRLRPARAAVAAHERRCARRSDCPEPCSRRTSPGTGSQRPYVASHRAVWMLHDAVAARTSAAILLGAFVGLRLAEACRASARRRRLHARRRIACGSVAGRALKSEISKTPVPIPTARAPLWRPVIGDGTTIVTTRPDARPGRGRSSARFVSARRVPGLPPEFRFHDLRHYFASLLIADGLDVKVVQARLRHASAKTTLDVYGHLWPDKDAASRAAVAAAITAHQQRAEHFTL